MSDEKQLHTKKTLVADFQAAGLEAGQSVLVHSAMGKIGGWISGGAEAVILALQEVLGKDGNLLMPTHSATTTDPARWRTIPVLEEWWEQIRNEAIGYHPATTATFRMGIIAESFRRFPDVQRSNHPIGSFAAWGKDAAFFTADHPLEPMFGVDSPIGRLYERDGWIMLLGCSYGNCTSLHLAEYQANYPKTFHTARTAVRRENGAEWLEFQRQDLEVEDFEALGADYEKAYPDAVKHGMIGQAQTLLMRQKPLVDFAISWIEQNRQAKNTE